MKFILPKGTGNVFCNLIRHAVYSQRLIVRPIAFKIGTSSNILSAGRSIVEDMLEFSACITELSYGTNVELSDGDIIPCNYTFGSVLRASDLATQLVKVITKENPELLHKVKSMKESNTEMCIYFRYASGCATQNENAEFLKDFISKKGGNPEIVDHLVVLSSRHTDITRFSFDITSDPYHDQVELHVANVAGDKEKTIFEEAKKSLIKFLQNVQPVD